MPSEKSSDGTGGEDEPVRLRPQDIARLLELTTRAGMSVPVVEAVVSATVYAIDCLEQVGGRWRSETVDIQADHVVLSFRRKA